MKLILACDSSGGIGYKNKLPWDKIQGDLPRFKRLTENKIVVMGRNTWDSLPKKPLPNRTNFVVTSDPYSIPYQLNHTRIFTITDLSTLKRFNENACIIGGARLIESTWDLIDTVHLTRTFTKYTCDAFIDLVKLSRDYTLQYEELNPDHTYEVWSKR